MPNQLLLFLFILFASSISAQEIVDSSTVHLEERIFFASNESELSAEDKSDIMGLLYKASGYSQYKLWVDAHTDDVGSESYNLALSERRKESVVHFLLSQNVPPSFIRSEFHGENRLVSVNQDDNSRGLNRRVVLQLVTQKKYRYLKGAVINQESKEGIKAQLRLTTKNYQKETSTDDSGNYKILSPINEEVTLEVVAKGHFIDSKTFTLSEEQRAPKIIVELPRVEIGKKFNFENMLFQGNRSVMLRGSASVLEHLKRFMILNDDYCIEIAGHVNLPNKRKVKTDSRNFQLSVARALEVHDALVKIGVDTSRLLARGYGNWEMLYPRAKKESEQQLNRRVEIIILDCETVSSLSNHSIPNRKKFQGTSKSGLVKYYSEESYEDDVNSFPAKAKNDIIGQVQKMKRANLDPSKYTYREMLIALPGIPRRK